MHPMHIMILDNGTLPVEDPKRKWTKLHQLLSSSLYKKQSVHPTKSNSPTKTLPSKLNHATNDPLDDVWEADVERRM